ncbi:MAG: hypothetical protein LRY41_01755 [Candidatus Pacebacteria bacterium]|nr:hypothetical protein [Candidatus Paceibacterota bacterium]
MIDAELQQIIDSRMAELPQYSKEALLASKWEQKLQALCAQHGLLLDEAENVYTETLLILLGVGYPELYEDNIVRRAGIDKKTADALIADIYSKIFEPLQADIIARTESASTLRNELFESATQTPAEREAAEPQALHPKRDDLIKEIEDPSKTDTALSRMKMNEIVTEPPVTSTHGQAIPPAPKKRSSYLCRASACTCSICISSRRSIPRTY